MVWQASAENQAGLPDSIHLLAAVTETGLLKVYLPLRDILAQMEPVMSRGCLSPRHVSLCGGGRGLNRQCGEA